MPNELNKLYYLNFNPLNQKIKEDIKRWNLIPVLTFQSRIESVRMNVQPRVLFPIDSPNGNN